KHEKHLVVGGAGRGFEGGQGGQVGCLGGGVVAGEGGGPRDDLRAGLPGHVGDVPVVGGDDDVRDVPGGPAGAHRAGHQRDAADGGEVLRGHTLGAAAGGDHGEHPAGRGRAGHGISSSIRDRGGGR